MNSLEDLWKYTKDLHSKHFPESNLEPIMSGGRLHKPKYVFVFINPTYRNISSDPEWEGRRRPWTGTKYIWRIFHQADHFDESLLDEINNRKDWDINFADKIYDHLADKGFYFTNLVKWTGKNADLPNTQKIKLFLPILLKEIEIVQPQNIVAFGLIPFNALIKEPIKLGQYYDSVMSRGALKTYNFEADAD